MTDPQPFFHHSPSSMASGQPPMSFSEEEREARQQEMRAASPIAYRTASPMGSSTPRCAILRSVDRNSSHLVTDKEKSFWTTPQKHQPIRPRTSPSRASYLEIECLEERAGVPSRSPLACTPNSIDMDVCSPSSEPRERPQCMNPVGLTLWQRETSVSEGSLLDSPAPMVAALSSPAKLLRPTATRLHPHHVSWGSRNGQSAFARGSSMMTPSGVY